MAKKSALMSLAFSFRKNARSVLGLNDHNFATRPVTSSPTDFVSCVVAMMEDAHIYDTSPWVWPPSNQCKSEPYADAINIEATRHFASCLCKTVATLGDFRPIMKTRSTVRVEEIEGNWVLYIGGDVKVSRRISRRPETTNNILNKGFSCILSWCWSK